MTKPSPERPKRTLDDCRIEYRERACLMPGCRAAPRCFAHYPHHRGMGGKNAGWSYNEGVPLCYHHHEALDARGPTWRDHLQVLATIEKLAPPFWEKVKREHESRKGT